MDLQGTPSSPRSTRRWPGHQARTWRVGRSRSEGSRSKVEGSGTDE